ncbi:MAG TPA: S-layer homology domain-containing protein, partial [Chloroflexia bacterium]|nr:S-layer homology domain-containing protein [Chloroflexia bacterium]
VAIQDDGKIVMAGHANSVSSSNVNFCLIRMNSDGSIDNTFDGDGIVTTDFFGNTDEAHAVALQAGKIVVAGYAQVNGFNYDFALARYNPNGSLDTTFSGDGKATVDIFGGDDGAFAMALQPDGQIVAAGGAFYEPSSYNFAVARLLSNGDLDTGFGVGGIKVEDLGGGGIDNANAVAIQPDGRIVLAGFAPVGGVNRFALARFATNGFLDPGFGGGDGWLTTGFGGGSGDTRANGIAIQSDSRIVVAGTADMGSTNNYDYALARYLSGLEPPPTPTFTPVATQTPGGPTATPTSCALQFPDVPPGSTFYDFVRCLACRDIISGYPDGTFGPNNPVTRGQLSKIVSNSAGYGEYHITQHFQDVAVDSTFYLFIARLYTRGHISGYACGGAGEPCVPPGNLPYFRPNANVTRGQTSKIVASARGLPAPPPGLWTFQDVPQGSTFWQWIESLSSAGAITGYPCGGAGEPCVPPENRYYFRPNNQVTRGQSAKIVANSFFPGCQTP